MQGPAHRASTRGFAILVLFLMSQILVLAFPSWAEMTTVDFTSDRWNCDRAQITEYAGRTCVMGTAFLKDLDLGNGVIEVDLAVTRDRNYPGVNFRIQSPSDYERLYIRPHRFKFYPDAVQYTPCTNGISSWQLYNGEGATATTEQPYDEWVTLRIELSGPQARVYYGDLSHPVLEVDRLAHGTSRGTLGVDCRANGTAYFSNFRYEETEALQFETPPPINTPPGLITSWEISPAFTLSAVDLEEHPSAQDLGPIEWTAVETDETGVLDIAQYTGRLGRQTDVVFARAELLADAEEVLEYRFGYSDAISIFLNGEILFFGNSSYQSRDPNFLGILNPYDNIYLRLQEGSNELCVILAEGFGGWGLYFQHADALFLAEGAAEAWESGEQFKTPESVVWDPEREQFYVSNYDALQTGPASGAQTVSRVSAQGELLESEWISGLHNPTGMVLQGERLWVVDRQAVVEVNVATGEVVKRHAMPEGGFPNDIALSPDGDLYVSDPGLNQIHRIRGEEVSVWIDDPEIEDPNGLCADRTFLYVGNNGDGRVKAVNLETKEVRTVTRLGSGIIDGLALDRDGDLLATHWQGRVFRITADGDVEKLIDTSVLGRFLADFGYLPESNRIVVPTFYGNRLVAYDLPE